MLRRKLFIYGLILWGFTSLASADERHFTYSYEADSILPKGHWELEQWVTLRAGKEDGQFDRWDFREEVEYGLTDRLTTALYFNFNDIHSDGVPGREDEDGMNFDGISSEWKYMLLSPHLYPVGVLLYFEPTYSGKELELEEKLILEHIFSDRWILTANIIGEHEWEFEDDETQTEGVLELTAGLSYQINESWSVGVEGKNQREFPDYQEQENSAWFVGPNVHYGNGKWWATLTVLPQVTDVLDAHEEVEVRFIAGVLF